MANIEEQREWYEAWHGVKRLDLPVETLKQEMRLFALHKVLRAAGFNHPLVIGCGQGMSCA